MYSGEKKPPVVNCVPAVDHALFASECIYHGPEFEVLPISSANEILVVPPFALPDSPSDQRDAGNIPPVSPVPLIETVISAAARSLRFVSVPAAAPFVVTSVEPSVANLGSRYCELTP